MVTLTITGPFTAKDQAKASCANKFIGRGSARSSTNSYANDFGALANTGAYVTSDIVFISAEGNRSGRLSPDFVEIRRAVTARAIVITDVPSHRNRPYNIGEREVATFLTKCGYYESPNGTWKPS